MLLARTMPPYQIDPMVLFNWKKSTTFCCNVLLSKYGFMLERDYPANGLYRSDRYASFLCGVQTMDIHKNIGAINGLLTGTANTTRDLFKHSIVSGFNYSYCSTHSLDGNEILIYHLMFDFSKNIK